MIEFFNEPMAKHTTFRTGGPARRFVKAESVQDIIDIKSFCDNNNEKLILLGNGSNVLVSDKGLDATVLYIGEEMSRIDVNDETIYAEAGALLSKVARVALENELEGFEFASGIPGFVGGAVFMNAGAYGGEMKDIVLYCDCIVDGKTVRIPGEDMDFSYRHSIASEKNMIITGAAFKLKKGDAASIKEKMDDLNQRRREKQPLEYPSAGSTFKRPEGYFAGKLIMDSGLKGYRVGGACVSPKHCGFVVNDNGATSDDIYKLIKEVGEIVFDKFGVRLEPEVRLLGEF